MAYEGLEEAQLKSEGKQSWWARLNTRKKIIICAVVAVVILALAIGLGVGLTRGHDDDDGGDDNGVDNLIPSGTPTATPTAVWQPKAGASWQIVLLKPINITDDATEVTPDVDVYDIDLWDTTVGTIRALKRLNKKVICYFSAGTSEDWRQDFKRFNSDDMGKGLPEWKGERWLRLNSQNVRNIMTDRIRLAAWKECDAIDPDNVDGFDNDNGLGLKQSDSVEYMKFLSAEAKKYNMAIGLKNAGAIIPSILDDMQFCVNEQCVENSECTTFSAFTKADKPVFHIEYPFENDDKPSITADNRDTFCSGQGKSAGSQNFSTLLKKMNLDGFVEFCNGTTADTPIKSRDS